jgi:hypothetical protein
MRPDDDIRDMSATVEEDLRKWKPTKTDRAAPPSSLLKPSMDISGTWRVSRGFYHSTLWIRRLGSSSYAVSFKSDGCMSGWSLKRTGTFSNGIVVLDRPVKDYPSSTYARLFAVRLKGVDYLVSDALATRFKGSPRFCGFRRVSSQRTSGGRAGN